MLHPAGVGDEELTLGVIDLVVMSQLVLQGRGVILDADATEVFVGHARWQAEAIADLFRGELTA